VHRSFEGGRRSSAEDWKTGVGSLIYVIADFIRSHNQTPKPFPWQKTSDEILAAIARFASRTINAHS
jgi:hypothetical protein